VECYDEAMRWLYHVVPVVDLGWGPEGRFRARSLETEGFVHASFKERVLESARIYFAGTPDSGLRVLRIDPRRLDVPVRVVDTPRGPMPHVHGAIPVDAVTVLGLDEVESQPDGVFGTRIGVASFDGMTLLDLVGPLDALSRIEWMGFDRATTCEVFALTRGAGDPPHDVVTWRGSGAAFTVGRYRPALDAYDVLVLPGGPGTQSLADDAELAAYLRSYPDNRLLATVCTGALLAGAAGRLRGRRATTHRTALEALASFGATAVDARVVEDGNVVTAGGVTAGIDLGLHVVRRLVGDHVTSQIARQMNVPSERA
jgi:cyclohexyl-isocyanide hydratase